VTGARLAPTAALVNVTLLDPDGKQTPLPFFGWDSDRVATRCCRCAWKGVKGASVGNCS